MTTVEANFDGLVGPTHNYAGLAFGNVASARNARRPSNPREAATQGLRKMRALMALGLHQGILPPQERPHIPTLKRLGFSGKDADILRKVKRESPGLLAAASSASSMWVANAATVSPSADTADGKVHFTPANLCGNLHRALEPDVTSRILQAIFPADRHFVHHPALPPQQLLGDEGAANHTRLCTAYGDPGLELFVYGRGSETDPLPQKFPPRQTRAASEAIARLHLLDPDRTYFAQQHPSAIDQGVFHNDVIAVGNREVLLYHEEAFLDEAGLRAWVEQRMPLTRPIFLRISTEELTVEEAVHAYLFNSQLVSSPDGAMHLVVAKECEEHARAWACVQRVVQDDANPISRVHVFDLRQSMNNGGGPACLRLRVVLDESERGAVNGHAWLTEARYDILRQWINQHYRDHLTFEDLADPQLLDESRTALDRLTQILGLGSVYDFQR